LYILFIEFKLKEILDYVRSESNIRLNT